MPVENTNEELITVIIEASKKSLKLFHEEFVKKYGKIEELELCDEDRKGVGIGFIFGWLEFIKRLEQIKELNILKTKKR